MCEALSAAFPGDKVLSLLLLLLFVEMIMCCCFCCCFSFGFMASTASRFNRQRLRQPTTTFERQRREQKRKKEEKQEPSHHNTTRVSPRPSDCIASSRPPQVSLPLSLCGVSRLKSPIHSNAQPHPSIHDRFNQVSDNDDCSSRPSQCCCCCKWWLRKMGRAEQSTP